MNKGARIGAGAPLCPDGDEGQREMFSRSQKKATGSHRRDDGEAGGLESLKARRSSSPHHGLLLVINQDVPSDCTVIALLTKPGAANVTVGPPSAASTFETSQT